MRYRPTPPPYWKNRWTEFNPELCFKAKCSLVPVERGLPKQYFCQEHRLFHMCGWSPCAEGTCRCIAGKPHAYTGSRCPTYLNPEGYVCCQMTRERLESFPSSPFVDGPDPEGDFEPMEEGHSFDTAVQAYFAKKEGVPTEGQFDDMLFLSDKQANSFFMKGPNRADFRRMVDPKLFCDCLPLNEKQRYEVYVLMCRAFKAEMEFSDFKRRKKTNIRRALHLACTQYFHSETYKLLLQKHSFWTRTKTYRKLSRLQQHFLKAIKVVYPVKEIREGDFPPDPSVIQLCRYLEEEEKKEEARKRREAEEACRREMEEALASTSQIITSVVQVRPRRALGLSAAT